MTTWDKIYKNYNQRGEAWATLSEDIDTRFIKFIKETTFKTKYTFDIGCGTGKYLKYLQTLGFKTDGIDSSETSVKMAKEQLNDNATIERVDMFDCDIPLNKYDLIISFATIHHGLKKDIQELVNKIYRSLKNNGYIFITVPDAAGIKIWRTLAENKKIAKATYAPLIGPEKGLPHSFYTKEEVEELFSVFQDIKLELDEIGRWFVIARK